jgi:hypothetical protein
MQECQLVKILILAGVNLSTNQCLKTQEEEGDMPCVPYVSVGGSLMDVMVYTKPSICQNR